MTKLPGLGALWPIVTITIIEMVFTVVVAMVAVIVAPFITVVIITTRWAIGLRHLGDVFPMAVVGVLRISVLVSYPEHLTNRGRWLPIELPLELVMVI